MAQLGGAVLKTKRSHTFNSGNMPMLQVQSLMGHVQEGNLSMFLSLSFSAMKTCPWVSIKKEKQARLIQDKAKTNQKITQVTTAHSFQYISILNTTLEI